MARERADLSDTELVRVLVTGCRTGAAWTGMTTRTGGKAWKKSAAV